MPLPFRRANGQADSRVTVGCYLGAVGAEKESLAQPGGGWRMVQQDFSAEATTWSEF